MHNSYIQIQSYIAATCIGVIYAVVRELVHIKRAFVSVMNEQFNSIQAHVISNVRAPRKISTSEQNINNSTL